MAFFALPCIFWNSLNEIKWFRKFVGVVRGQKTGLGFSEREGEDEDWEREEGERWGREVE